MQQVIGRGAMADVLVGQMAIKRYKDVEEGRYEADILLALKHPNIIHCYGVDDSSEDHFDLLLKWYPLDLARYLSRVGNKIVQPKLLQSYLWQILAGLSYLHENSVIHVDLKPDNILIDKEGHLVICDFSHAFWDFENNNEFSRGAISITAPENLLEVEYLPEYDVWSAACIAYEMAVGRQLFSATNELTQLRDIFQLCGTPTEKDWPKSRSSKLWKLFADEPCCVGDLSTHLATDIPNSQLCDLLQRMLVLNPAQRISAAKALEHPYFDGCCHKGP